MRLETNLRGYPNRDLVQGYPGIKATAPRLEGIVEIKDTAPPSPSKPCSFKLLEVKLGVYRTDTIHAPSRVTSIKRENCSLVTRQKTIYQSDPTSSNSSCYGAEIPFTLSFIPNDTPTASISINKSVKSEYTAFVIVDYFDDDQQYGFSFTMKFPIRLKKFNTLPLFKVFQQPIINEINSTDYLCSLRYTLLQTAFGHGDMLKTEVVLLPNPDWPKSKKVRIKKLSLELVQLTKYFVEHLHAKEEGNEGNRNPNSGSNANANGNGDTMESEIEVIEVRSKLDKFELNVNSTKDSKPGIDCPIELQLQVPSALEQHVDDNVLPKESAEVGYEGKAPFTNACSLYSVDFRLVYKAKLQNAKDIEGEQEIVISQFSRSAQVHYMNAIMNQANHRHHRDLRPILYESQRDTVICMS